MIKATCQECGNAYYGWAITWVDEEYCECGEKLEKEEEEQ